MRSGADFDDGRGAGAGEDPAVEQEAIPVANTRPTNVAMGGGVLRKTFPFIPIAESLPCTSYILIDPGQYFV
jgi:hypothetical protein